MKPLLKYIIGGMILGLIFALLALLGEVGAFLGCLVTILLVTLWIAVWIANRRKTRILTMRLIESSVRSELPLPELLECSAREQGGWTGRQLQELADELREGIPLPVAVDNHYRLFPYDGQLAIRVGGENDTLPECLALTINAQEQKQNMERYNEYFLFIYLFFLSFCAAWMLGFLTYFIIPKFRQILFAYSDLGQFRLIQYFDHVETMSSLAFVITGLAFLFMVTVLDEHFITRFRNSRRRPELNTLIGLFQLILRLVLPVFLSPYSLWLRFFPQRDTPQLLRLFSAAAKNGEPLEGTLHSLAMHYESPDIAKRLKRASESVEQGADFWTSLLNQKLISRMQYGFIQAADRSGRMDYMLQQLANNLDAKRRHDRTRWVEIGRTCFLILLCLFVAAVAIGMFAPLVELTTHLSLPEYGQ